MSNFRISYEGGTYYGTAFTALAQTIRQDAATLHGAGYRVFRPCAFFLTDNEPGDPDWAQTFTEQLTYDPATRKGMRSHPIFVPFGFRDAPEQVLRQLTYPKARGKWYHAKTDDVTLALHGILDIITNTVVNSANSTRTNTPNILQQTPPQGSQIDQGDSSYDPNFVDADFVTTTPPPVPTTATTAITRPGSSGASGTAPPSADFPSGGEQEPDARYQETAPDRYLRGRCPDAVRVGEPFSVLVSIVRDGTGNDVPLKAFHTGPGGQDVLLVLHAPGLQVLSGQRLTVHLPPNDDSEPVMFELRAGSPGICRMSITAWLGGTYLGELMIETIADSDSLTGRGYRDFLASVDTVAPEGAVSLVVRYDPVQNAYRFEFRDEDNPDEVPGQLAYEPGPRVESLVAELDRVAKGRAGDSASETRDYLREAGMGLWRELVPEQLRRQFWERQHKITQLTILADKDTVPWELLYPLDPGHDAGFLVEQFPVTRMVFRRRPARLLGLSPAWFVLPDGSPTRARDEVSELLRLLQIQSASGSEPVIGRLTPLLELIRAGNFGLLHFACHNAFDPASGSAISLDNRQFTPTHLNSAAIGQILAWSTPTVFINACRSSGLSPAYHQLDGWAGKFLEAGAGAFIGTLWAVRDETALKFASELYSKLQAGNPLGKAVMQARLAAANEPGDPTWLAYSVYGDPRATLR